MTKKIPIAVGQNMDVAMCLFTNNDGMSVLIE